MPRIAADELTESRVAALMEQAQAAVDAGWVPSEHLPANIFKFLEPLTIASGQGFYTTTMMILGALPALCNGATIQLWPGRPTPLMAIVLQVAAAQKGKSRLTALVEEAFDSCDDYLVQKAKEMVADYPGASPVVKTLSLQSFTFTEFFHRCSSEWQQVDWNTGDERNGLPHRIWLSSGFCLDEAYEFLEGLGMMGTSQKGEGGKTASLNASSLNRLIQAGSHKRGTRTGTSSTTSRPPPVNLSVCGNLHPSKAISMERQLQGNHVAACKERFIFCCDRSTPRHAELPADYISGDSAWTWLPLTPQQAVIFDWEAHLNRPAAFSLPEDQAPCNGYIGAPEGYPLKLPDGVLSRVRFPCSEHGVTTEWRISARWCQPNHIPAFQQGLQRAIDFFGRKPQLILPMTAGAQRLLLGEPNLVMSR
ncbi:unnamed protein product [Cladocopium goreaui]|uniref:COG complex component COG2 C-terminal domain-containing protein n=1 Tax=Cladocopium goreaui TaxID=2562237 RepID=A0A9P1GK40_9DINO|nr:unnamed protein product [Cladocopium goreaui]